MLPYINSIWRIPLILLVTIILASISVVCSVVDRSGRLQHRCACLWAAIVLRVSRVRVQVVGLSKLDCQRGYIIMPNHLSMFDHWVLLSVLPFQFRFAAKASLFDIPFLGWHLRRAGNVPVDRSQPRKTLKIFKNVGEQIREKRSLVIYPEGERTFGDKVNPFKRGAFLLARHAEAPIVPVTLIGSHRRLARGSIVSRPGTIEIVIHEALEFRDYNELRLEEVAARVHEVVVSRYRQVPQ
jgi:1-acyl-sn-glycerol-3-phosphate acyltransferase